MARATSNVSRPLDVTVVVPPALQAAFDGRREVVLGVPAGATPAEVVETLLLLYPRLRGELLDEREVAPRTLHLFLPHPDAGRLAPGDRLYLFATPRRPLAPPAGEED